VKKTIASTNEIVFSDRSVTINQKWFITNIAVADSRSAEFTVYKGIERDVVKTFNGDGNKKEFTLAYNGIEQSDYITVTVDENPKICGTDYVLQQNQDDETKTDIVFIDVPGIGVNNISITYDAVKVCLGLFVQADSSESFEFGAPIKLDYGQFFICSVKNKAANAAVVILNVNGFFEEAI